MPRIYGIKKRWLTNILGTVALILALTVAVLFITVYYFFYTNLTSQLITRADASAMLFQSYINSSSTEFHNGAKRYAEDFVDRDKLEFEVINTDGRVLFSSSTALLSGYRPGTPDVEAALAQHKTASYAGRDSVSGERVISVTTPVYLANGELAGGLRYITGLGVVNSNILTISLAALGACAVVFLFVLFSNSYFIRSIVTPLHIINETTKKIAAGDYGVTIDDQFKDEIGELAEAINFMSGEIGRSAAVKNDFISSVSHELRTPLTAISGWAETLLQGEVDRKSIEARGLAVIADESARLKQLLEDLLDFSKIESGRLVLSRAPFDLGAELEDTIFMFEQRLAQDGMHVVYEDNLGEARVLGDKSRLKQVFVNIIDNARKYSKQGDTIDISLSKSPDPGRVRVTISDRGVGISPEDLPHVKEKFYKGKSTRPGSGIGLAVSDEIIALHGGALTLESEPGQGTRVVIDLPAHRA